MQEANRRRGAPKGRPNQLAPRLALHAGNVRENAGWHCHGKPAQSLEGFFDTDLFDQAVRRSIQRIAKRLAIQEAWES